MSMSSHAPQQGTAAAAPILSWGFLLFAASLAVLGLAAIWLWGDDLGWRNTASKKTATLWLAAILASTMAIHALASRVGAYRAAGWLFRQQTNTGRMSDAEASASPASRLLDLRKELFDAHGYRSAASPAPGCCSPEMMRRLRDFCPIPRGAAGSSHPTRYCCGTGVQRMDSRTPTG